jgi:hypothetical protein
MTSFVRIWLPVAVVAAGLVAIALNPTVDGLEGAAHIIGAGLAIWLLNLLVRIGISGERDRDAEDATRVFFDEHGYWPDEAPEQTPPSTLHRTPAPHGHRVHGAPRQRGGR